MSPITRIRIVQTVVSQPNAYMSADPYVKIYATWAMIYDQKHALHPPVDVVRIVHTP